ncbi:class I SAM-dependent methyltransferase [Dactylosporangium sp. NBC_01737]|uniref:class I SAM-dependent methyltransferase n=1 Tax=Dactylosporangium sp. NBC_01737 TaxID=2975959 RepID=UPI002E106480|nr:class I SAM-dependent methyltransferase [Dactylosporangium sp. NBC_01737]
MQINEPYYRRDLAYVFDQGYGFHAEACAPGILALLEPVRAGGGVVLEIGCGSGLLTKRLVEAGHRVIATDASPAMLDLTRAAVPGAEDIRTLVLPDDPLPAVDAVVGIGHALNYLPDKAAVHRALVAIAGALLPGGLLAVDLCDLEWGAARQGAMAQGRVGDDWAIVTRFSQPAPDRFDRDLTTFVRGADGSYRREDEHHGNVLIDTSAVPALLSGHGVTATIGGSFDDEDHPLPVGLHSVIGHRARKMG